MTGSTITLQDYPLETALDLFREAGFDRLEMWKHHLKQCRTDQLRKLFTEYACRTGIAMAGFNAVGEDYFQPFGSDAELERTLDGLKADTLFALSLGTPDVLIWEGRAPANTTEHQWINQYLPRLTELMREIIAFGKPLGARYLAEPHPFTVGMSDRFLIALCDALDDERFGITFDFCHYGVGRRTDYVDAIYRLGPRIRHIHFSDTDGQTSELHFPPGTGCLDIDRMLDAFREIGYKHTITLDLYGYPMPVQALRSAGERMRAAADFLQIPL